MDVFLNGKMVPHEQAALSIDDAGFQHAVGLFETMYACQGRVFRLAQHLQRLAQSAGALGLARTIDPAPLAQAVQQTLERNQLQEARIRLTLTAGNISLLRPTDPRNPPLPNLLVVASPPTQYDPDYFEKGILTLVGPGLANPFDPLAGHKSLSYWNRLRVLRQAATAGAGEAICLYITNHLAGGMISNLFLVKGGELLTPIARGEEAAQALPSPVLPGVTRGAVIELAESLGIPIRKRMLAMSDLLDAEEAFLTNSSWHLLPIRQVEQKLIRDGRVGPLTRRLRAALLDLIQRETASAAHA